MSVVLIGMMGAGKTTLGREAARIAGFRFRDLDKEIEKLAGMAVPQIFESLGEARFRSLETEVLASLASVNKMVISAGGGTPMTPGNWELLRAMGPIIYLRADPGVLAVRLRQSKTKRPLLAGEDLEGKLAQLLKEREPVYEKADLVLDVGSGSRYELVQRLAMAAKGSE